MPFKPNPRFVSDVARSSEMKHFLDDVSGDAASEVESRLPYPNILGGLDVSHDVRMSLDGWEGEVRVAGPGWHLYEYGTINYGARPAIRPGVQAALTPRGGRLGIAR